MFFILLLALSCVSDSYSMNIARNVARIATAPTIHNIINTNRIVSSTRILAPVACQKRTMATSAKSSDRKIKKNILSPFVSENCTFKCLAKIEESNTYMLIGKGEGWNSWEIRIGQPGLLQNIPITEIKAYYYFGKSKTIIWLNHPEISAVVLGPDCRPLHVYSNKDPIMLFDWKLPRKYNIEILQ